VQDVQLWGRSWPTALAVFRVAAERAWLHPEAAQFTFVPHLAKLAAEAFIVEQLMSIVRSFISSERIGPGCPLLI
jgi:hypothetical protein